ncbi:unnamed protein product, partial [Mesorhabditis belari]|uniref:Arrestin C-terminal-like domain-containing protein n=1 Tax=Mesorhabditis belari TaxID=2138241 RepID=A0AAF3EEL2_9BILA
MKIQINFSRTPPVFEVGEIIEGTVVLMDDQEFAGKTVSIRAKGKVKNRWYISTGQSTLVYQAIIDVFEKTDVVVLEKSRFNEAQIPFNFKIPPNCLPSFKESDARIEYKITVFILKNTSTETKHKAKFFINNHLDLRYFPELSQPLEIINEKSIGLWPFKKGDVMMKVLLPRKGWAWGELCPVTVLIENSSSRVIDQLEILLNQRHHFRGYLRRKKGISIDDKLLDGSWAEKRKATKTLVWEKIAVQVPQNSVKELTISLQIPTASCSFECPISKLDYQLKVIAHSLHTTASKVELKSEIVLGSTPFKS